MPVHSHSDSRIIVALDYSGADEALEFVSVLSPELCRLKVGFELYVSAGPEFVRKLVMSGFDVFLDLKFHDIPNTVASACAAAARLGVWMINVHASGGKAMMQAAKAAVEAAPVPPKLIAVTILTSLDGSDMKDLGIEVSVEDQVTRLARMAQTAGLDGVVCSAVDASRLRHELNEEPFLLVTPGIRLDDKSSDDQKRVFSPAAAIQAGSNYLVIGRPITQAADPLRVLESIQNDISRVLS